MKSVKPGRGPSMMGGIVGVFIALCGVFWTISAAQMGAPFFFQLFGICFVAIAVIQAVYNFKNAASKNRHSEFDIVDSREEPDPWNMRPDEVRPVSELQNGEVHYCPYCGAPAEDGFAYCAKCGKKLPL